jgi:autotransporter-associated beta strand protein
MRLSTFLLPLALLGLTTTAPAGTPDRPNIIVIISDDGGFADWEFMDGYIQTLNPGQAGSPVPTPHLNSLRDRGVLFTNAYTASVCSPSRAAIVTGSYQQRIGYEYNINNLPGATAVDGLHPDVVTIFDRMKAEGYSTGAIGKWHLGARAPDAGLGNRPENQGVDEFFGIWKGSRNYTVGSTTGVGELRETIAAPFRDTVLETTAPWNTTSNYVTNAFGQGAVAFIDRHYADPDPFFLYVAFTSPHGPIGPSPDINDPRLAGLSGTRKNYASMVLTMDKEVGNILAKLDDPAGDGSVSLTDNTLIIFINDNGGASGIGTINTPLNNWKGSVYEGGNRVPMLIAGPGVPSNATAPIEYDAPVHSIDILPTCVEAGGGTPISNIDGVNLIPFLDGTNPDDPHEFITIRNGNKVGVRRGDWKLTKNGGGSTFALYNLANDIGESTDLSGANPAIVGELLREFTRFEAGCDKPRHAGLNKSPDSINLNDRFILHPQPASTGTFTPDGLTLVGGTTRNGDFNAGGGTGAQTYAQTPDWTNISSGGQSQNATNTTLNANGTRNAIIAENVARAFGLDTGHTLAAGERFRATYQWRDASNWTDGNDRVRISLFITSDDTLAGNSTTIQSLNSGLSQADSTYQDETAVFDPIPASAAGKRLFVAINAAQTGNGFARLDDFVLERGTTGTGGGTTSLDWSDSNAWKDADTNNSDTLLTLDAFPGAILEFPVRDTFSYRANNDMTRMSGLDFMLNQVRLTGTFTGTTPQSATIDGNDLMLTNDLDGNAPAIAITATGPAFSFEIATDLVLYDDLTISGNGTATVEITGTIRDHVDPRGLMKSGTSTILLSGAHSYAGITTVSGGTLLLNSGATLQNSSVVVEPAGNLGGNGTVNGSISGPGTVAPGQSIGTVTVTGNASPGRLVIEIDDDSTDLLTVAGTLDLSGSTLAITPLAGGIGDHASIIATYGSLTGTFAAITNLPPGYSIDYAYNDGDSSTNIALVPDLDPYTAWTTSSGVSGPDADFDADPNHDGIVNGLAFFFGAPTATTNAAHLAPAAVVGSEHLEFSFLRADAAASLAYEIEYSYDLTRWSSATSGTAGVVITETDNGPTDVITAHLPKSLAFDPVTGPQAFLFSRLVVEE